jgi:stage V sporulation protein T
VAKTALDVFQDILDKQTLERNDLELMISQVKVYEDHLEIQLQPDIDALLHAGVMEVATNFKLGTENIEQATIVQRSVKRRDKVFRANVIRDGDPLEIYTEKDGEVIFKKYSPMGELSDFAGQMCETLSKSTGVPVSITDRDSVIAVCGAPRRELFGKQVSAELESIMEARQVYRRAAGERAVAVSDSDPKYVVKVAAPILSEGDLMGCVLFFGEDGEQSNDVEYKLAQTVAGFLGKQMEN